MRGHLLPLSFVHRRENRRRMRQVFAWPLLLIASAALAVPPGEVSSSAETVCMMRAIGAQQPDPKLRNADTLAASFCPLPAELASYEAARAGINLNPQQSAGFFYVNARTLHIDALLLRAAREGATQVVVLGAGFDSRAYRFAASQPRLRFFWTQAEAAAFVVANGLVVTNDLGSEQLTQRYLIGSDGRPDGRMLEGNRILEARVP